MINYLKNRPITHVKIINSVKNGEIYKAIYVSLFNTINLLFTFVIRTVSKILHVYRYLFKIYINLRKTK